MVNNATDIANPPVPILAGISQMRRSDSLDGLILSSPLLSRAVEEGIPGWNIQLMNKYMLTLCIDLITCDDGGHIVGSASAEGQVHQASAGAVGVGVMLKDLGDRVVAGGPGQAVGAEEQGVAVEQGELVDLGKDALAGAADDVGHDVAPLVLPGVLGRDRAAVDQGLDERMVAGQLLEFALAE